MRYLLHAFQYFKARLSEKSTWAAVSVGISAAAVLPAPWSYAFIVASVIAALVPTPKRKPRK